MPISPAPQPMHLSLCHIQTSGCFQHPSQLIRTTYWYIRKLKQRTTVPIQQPSCPYIIALLRSSTSSSEVTNSCNIDFMQPNTFSSSTGTAPTFANPIVPPLYRATVPNPLFWSGPPQPTPLAPSLDSGYLIKLLADAITKKNNALPDWKLTKQW